MRKEHIRSTTSETAGIRTCSHCWVSWIGFKIEREEVVNAITTEIQIFIKWETTKSTSAEGQSLQGDR